MFGRSNSRKNVGWLAFDLERMTSEVGFCLGELLMAIRMAIRYLLALVSHFFLLSLPSSEYSIPRLRLHSSFQVFEQPLYKPPFSWVRSPYSILQKASPSRLIFSSSRLQSPEPRCGAMKEQLPRQPLSVFQWVGITMDLWVIAATCHMDVFTSHLLTCRVLTFSPWFFFLIWLADKFLARSLEDVSLARVM